MKLRPIAAISPHTFRRRYINEYPFRAEVARKADLALSDFTGYAQQIGSTRFSDTTIMSIYESTEREKERKL